VRQMAIVQVSVFEAANAITGRYPTSRVKVTAAPGASVDAAVAAATPLASRRRPLSLPRVRATGRSRPTRIAPTRPPVSMCPRCLRPCPTGASGDRGR
jgi:hypothetical protein